MAKRMKAANAGSGAVEQALALAEAAEASVAEVERLHRLGMGPIERVDAARIRAAAAQLRACAERLASEPLMVHGSMGQMRPHPLLKVEAELRKEISAAIKDLNFRASNRAMIERSRERRQRGRAEAKEREK